MKAQQAKMHQPNNQLQDVEGYQKLRQDPLYNQPVINHSNEKLNAKSL